MTSACKIQKQTPQTECTAKHMLTRQTRISSMRLAHQINRARVSHVWRRAQQPNYVPQTHAFHAFDEWATKDVTISAINSLESSVECVVSSCLVLSCRPHWLCSRIVFVHHYSVKRSDVFAINFSRRRARDENYGRCGASLNRTIFLKLRGFANDCLSLTRAISSISRFNFCFCFINW